MAISKANVKSWFRMFRRNVFPSAKHRIVYAFTHAGIDYYKFDNAHGDLPYKRGLEAIICYRELQMMCSFDFLKKHVAKVDSIINAPRFTMQNAVQLQKLNTQLGERLTLPFEPSLAMRLAAVVFFDSTENPYEYDAKYAEEKVKRWGAGAGVRDFFTQLPVMELIPFLQNYEGDIQTYSQTIEAVNKLHLESVSVG